MSAIIIDAVQVPLVVFAYSRAWYPFRWSRFVRPALLPFQSKTCAHMVRSIMHTVPSLADLALLMCALVLFYSLLGTSLFGSSIEDRTAAAAAAANTTSLMNATSIKEGLFSTDRAANPLGRLHYNILHMIMLLYTADNYPYILLTSYNCDEVACSVVVGTVVFMSFIFFGTIILMSVFVAVVFDVYKRQHGYVILAERVEQQKALLATFALLDLSGDGKLSTDEFDRLLIDVSPGVTKQSKEMAFQVLDKDDDNVIDQTEFLEVSDVLMMKVPSYSERFKFMSWHWPPMRKVADSKTFNYISDLLILLYIILLVLIASDIKWSKQSVQLLGHTDTIFVGLFTIELLVKVLGLSLSDTWSDMWNRLDVIVVLLSYVAMALEAAFASLGSGVAALRALRLLRLLRLLRAIRAFGKISGASMKTRVLMATFAQFGRVIMPMLLILICFSYAYAIIGMETLHNALSIHYAHNFGTYCSPICPSFDRLANAMLTLFQLLIAANWSPVLDEAMNNSGLVIWPSVYFLAYLTFCHVFMLSLLAALVLEVYAVEMDKAAHDDSENKLQLLCDAGRENEALAKESADLAKEAEILAAGVQKKFREFDVDRSGSLHAEELANLLKCLDNREHTDEEVQQAIKELDTDGTGLVDYDEFLPWWRRTAIQQVFHKYDVDGSGSIDSKELGYVMKELGLTLSATELADALKKLDTSGDGYIGLDEYLAWFDMFDMQTEFNKFDKDGSGTVNRREFLLLATALGLTLTKKERDRVFDSLDIDKGGVVSFAEFHPWFKAVRENTKQFVLHRAKDDWEEELFLRGESDQLHKAQTVAADLLRVEIDEIAEEIQKGKKWTKEELLARLVPVSPDSPTATLEGKSAGLKNQYEAYEKANGIETIKA